METAVRIGFPEGERERVAGILYDALEGVFRPVFGPRERAVRAIARYLRQDRIITALSDGRVVGVCGLSYGKKRFLDLGLWDVFRDFALSAFRVMFVGAVFDERPRPGEAVLESLAVAPEFRGQGIGGLLLEHAIAHVRKQGLRRMRLYVASGNERALRFYERRGFQAVRFQPLPFPWNGIVGLVGAYELVKDLATG